MQKARLFITVTLVLLATAGCCSLVYPGFAGVPEEVDRSGDFALPLNGDAPDKLVKYLAARGNRMAVDDDDIHPDEIRKAKNAYGEVLKRLERAVKVGDLQDGTDTVMLFEGEYGILTIHDARVGRNEHGELMDLTSRDIRGLVSKNFVFAFYRRRLVRAEDENGVRTPVAWVFAGTDKPDEYDGLVVFRKSYAIPTEAR